MNSNEKIKGMLTLLELNDDQFCYEMTSLAQKINNFLDDRSRLLSAQWLSVMFTSLTEEHDIETVEISNKKSVGIDTYATIDISANDILDESNPIFEDSRFALV